MIILCVTLSFFCLEYPPAALSFGVIVVFTMMLFVAIEYL